VRCRSMGSGTIRARFSGTGSARVRLAGDSMRSMPRRLDGPLRLQADVVGEHLHVECLDCHRPASWVDYSVEDGWLNFKSSNCGRSGRLKMAHHTIWGAKGHGETARGYRERVAAHSREKLTKRRPGERIDPGAPARKRRVRQ
jgi:hypothetical protein